MSAEDPLVEVPRSVLRFYAGFVPAMRSELKRAGLFSQVMSTTTAVHAFAIAKAVHRGAEYRPESPDPPPRPSRRRSECVGWLKSADVSGRLGVTERAVTKRCLNGTLIAERFADGWLIEPGQVERETARKERRGSAEVPLAGAVVCSGAVTPVVGAPRADGPPEVPDGGESIEPTERSE